MAKAKRTSAAPAQPRTTARRAPKRPWFKEMLIGVGGTVIAAIILALLGLSESSPWGRFRRTPEPQQASAVNEATSSRLPVAAIGGSAAPTAELPASAAPASAASAAPKNSADALLSVPSSTPDKPAAYEPNRPTLAPGVHAPAAPPSISILGKWEQWVYNPETEQWVSGGIYRVAIKQQQLVMTIINNSEVDPDFINTQGITDVQYDGHEWSFTSQLEIGEVLQFKLQRTDDDTYEGHCYQNGVQLSPNKWQRVREPLRYQPGGTQGNDQS